MEVRAVSCPSVTGNDSESWFKLNLLRKRDDIKYGLACTAALDVGLGRENSHICDGS
jgi:hypothetical protein